MGKCPTCGGYVKDNKTATFESSQRRYGGKKQSAAVAIPEVGSTNIHNHSTAWPAIIATGFVCGVVLLPISWYVGVFLLDRAGFKEPERGLASGILIAGIALPALYLGSWILERIPRVIIREWGAIKLSLAEIEAERERSRSLTAGAPALPNERLTDEEKKLFENLAIVMEQAYRDLVEKRAPYKGGNIPRPWSKASVLSLQPPRYGRMSFMKATTVREWLVEHQVIIGDHQKDQINIDKFPTWADFQALLHNEFNMPVVVNAPQSPSLIGRYVDIDI